MIPETLLELDVPEPPRFSNEPKVSVQAIYAPRLTLSVADPPVQRRNRALLEKALGAANVQRMKAVVTARIDEIMDAFGRPPRTIDPG